MPQRRPEEKASMRLSLYEEHLILHLRMLGEGYFLVMLKKKQKGATGLGNFRVFESGALGKPPSEVAKE